MGRELKRLSTVLGTAALSVVFAAANALAQAEGSTTTTHTTTTTMWFSQWWLWAVGAGVFLIVVIALTNRGGSKRSS